LSETGIRNLLVIGLDVVSLADSARRAGYQIYAVDYFGDQDHKRICNENLSIIKQRPGKTCGYLAKHFDPKALIKLAKELIKKNKIDAALLSSGLDDSSDILYDLNDLIPIIGNNPQTVHEVRNKIEFFKQLKCLGIPHPKTALAQNVEEATKMSRDIGYPVLAKPVSGFGGAYIRKVKNSHELKSVFGDIFPLSQKIMIQEYIPGIPASMSLISSANAALALTFNEQLLGIHELGQKEPFGYCGNVVPLYIKTATKVRCESIAERIASHFGLVGSSGIDLVISKRGVPYVIEVNPRFQGTLECVERVLAMNIVDAHLKACLQGILPSIKKKLMAFCVRLILYARQRSVVSDLNTFEEVRDIPLPKVIIEEGEPICSIVVKGTERIPSLRKARTKAERIYNLLQSRTDR